MAVVSKYLDEAIEKYEKLGFSKHALSRGIVTVAIGAYVAHISYPFVTKLIKAAKLSPAALGKNNIKCKPSILFPHAVFIFLWRVNNTY